MLHVLNQTQQPQPQSGEETLSGAYNTHTKDYINELIEYKETGLLHKGNFKWIYQCYTTDVFFKDHLKLDDTSSQSPKTYARKILIKLVKTGDYKNDKWGYLTQAIIAYLETNPISGCKSANERQTEHQLRLQALCASPLVLQTLHQKIVDDSNTQAGFEFLTKTVNERGQHLVKQASLDMGADRKTNHSPYGGYAGGTNAQAGLYHVNDTWNAKGLENYKRKEKI